MFITMVRQLDYSHIRCCIIFGWLVCRAPRTFRSFVYYLYKYWICVHQTMGIAVTHPLTAEERQDFETLIQALVSAYKPYLTDQFASLDLPDGIPDEVVSGKIDCFEGEEASFGRNPYYRHSRRRFFSSLHSTLHLW
jgi:hypothetical protein